MSACDVSSAPLWMGPRAHWQAWAKHGVSRKVLKWIRYGVTIQGEAEVHWCSLLMKDPVCVRVRWLLLGHR